MCCRTVFWEEAGKELPKKPALAGEHREKPQNTQTKRRVFNSRPLPPVLEDILDFMKGASGIRPSST